MSSGSRSIRPATALFGGTFDPPHAGHREAVNGLFAIAGVRSVRVILSPNPPHKPTQASTEDRIEMTRLCFAPHAAGATPLRGPVEIELCEIDRARARPSAPTYSFDTLNELKPRYGEIAFVIGTDQLQALPQWHRFPDVLGLCHWIVLERKAQPGALIATAWRRLLADWEASGLVTAAPSGGDAPGSEYRIRSGGQGGGGSLRICPTEAPALSSTRIRESLARTGQPPAGSILPEVHAYLMKRRLYGTGPT